VKFGPKPVLTPSQIAHARELNAAGRPVSEISNLFGVHRTTIYRVLGQVEEV
jgi:DNA invertase Pin-like site-specific DNA recombinase